MNCADLSWREDLRKTVKLQLALEHSKLAAIRSGLGTVLLATSGPGFHQSCSFVSRRICVITCEQMLAALEHFRQC
jgi:hypothetical protein